MTLEECRRALLVFVGTIDDTGGVAIVFDAKLSRDVYAPASGTRYTASVSARSHSAGGSSPKG